MNLNKPLRIMLCAAVLPLSSLSFADFGVSHKNEYINRGMETGPVSGKRAESRRGRDRNYQFPLTYSPEAAENQKPFDFLSISQLLEAHGRGAIEETLGSHIDQEHLEALSAEQAFEEAFEEGDELFEIKYNALDGVGVNVGNGKRFARMPRPDLDGPMSWANVMPHRITGPNSDSCVSCHGLPTADGAGEVPDNTVRIDPNREQHGTIERQAPHMFGMGAHQLLAEEMTTELQSLRDAAVEEACRNGRRQRVSLSAKGVDFGQIRVSCRSINYRGLDGVDPSLVVKPFEWKGLTASVRDFVRGAAHQELGMQATELVGDYDADFDGVEQELTVGDVTALAVYAAAQPRPTTKLELNQIVDQLSQEVIEAQGLPLSAEEITSIENGERVFETSDCSSCHKPYLKVESPIFYEPSRHPDFRDAVFPAGEQVRMPQVAVQFDITSDLPNNPERLASGQSLGNFERDENGSAIVRLYADLKRHEMGSALAEEIDEGNLGSRSMFMTEALWGVGATPPYLHDGRASTLLEAIAYHGGDAEDSKNAFLTLSVEDQGDLIKFLENLVMILD